jgi:hypothetical protein
MIRDMNRWAAVLGLLLIVSNLAWLIAWQQVGQSERAVPTRVVTDGQIRHLDKQQSAQDRPEAAPSPVATQVGSSGGPSPATPDAGPQPDRSSASKALAAEWVRDALSLLDAGKRQAALEAIRSALDGGDPVHLLAALTALPELYDLAFDRASFRPLILPWLESSDPAVKVRAAWALFAAGAESGDLERILVVVADPAPEIQAEATLLVRMFSKDEIVGPAAEAVLKALDTDDRHLLCEGLRGVRGGRVSPEVEDRILAIAASPDPEVRTAAIYYALSTLAPKSEQVVDFLIEAVGSPVANDAYRAQWGLTFGVPPMSQEKVADLFLDVFSRPAAPSIRLQALRALANYGRERHADALSRFLDDPATLEALRDGIRQARDEIRAGLSRGR